MLRKLAIFIISAGLTMSPMAVQALGFGGIKLKSALNEKLNAEVDLLSASEDDVQSLKINLASEDAFLRAGIDRTALLNKLQFKVKKHPNGDYYIQVTTKDVIREPFMNFLLELNWKNGRMLREYTMLIDPPGRGTKTMAAPAPAMAETTAPVAEEAPAAEPAPVEPEPVIEPEVAAAEPEPAPVEETEPVAATDTMPEEAQVAEAPQEEAPIPEPEAVTEEAPVSASEETQPMEEAPAAAETASTEQPFSDETAFPPIPLTAYGSDEESAPSEEATIQEESQDTAAAGGEMGELDYGITQKGDNLWNIAEKLRQGDESVSVYQIMMALLQSNPDAFVDNNVHRLKVGHVLRISDPSLLTSMSRKEAAQAFIDQTDSWNNYRQQAAKAAGVQPIQAGDTAAAEESAPAETSGELTLASPDGETLSAGGGADKEALSNDLATLQDQLSQAKKDAGTMRTRNVALNEKLQALEDQLNNLQRSLSVKDDELAALQTQLAALNQKPAVPETAETEKPVEATSPAAEKEAVPQPEEEVKSEAVVEEKPAAESKPAEVPAKTEQPESAAKAPAAAPATTPAPGAEPAPATEPGIMDTVMGVLGSIGATVAGMVMGLNLGSDTLLFIAAPIALVLMIIVLIVIKRRRQGDNFQESILTGAASADTDGGGATSGDSTTFSEESSFLSDFAMSGASAIQADDSEVDPLTEADVFMAYGRYEAAEERLNEAVQNDPDRMELHAKLLELHHATKNKEAFEAAAEDFYARLAGNEAGNPLWEKVVSMGAELAPGNPLFNKAGAASGAIGNDSGMLNDPGMGMTDSQVMDIGLETGVFEAGELPGTGADSDMDFNLDLGESAATEETAADDFNLDLGDLGGSLDMGSTEAASSDLDFNLDIGGAEESAAEELSDMGMNLDMGTSADDAGMDFNLDIGGAEEPAGMDFDLDVAGDSADAGLDFNIGGGDDADIGGGDEVGTKLDLAKAYIDMGDPEGARSILDEVLDEGSATQKEEAQSLLGQIA